MFVKAIRSGDLRRRTLSWCGRTTISACNASQIGTARARRTKSGGRFFGSHMPNQVPLTPSCRLCHQLEYSNMKTGKRSLLDRLAGVFSIALVALAFSIGGSYVVRAEPPETLPSTLREMVFVPIMRAVQGLEQRLTEIGRAHV